MKPASGTASRPTMSSASLRPSAWSATRSQLEGMLPGPARLGVVTAWSRDPGKNDCTGKLDLSVCHAFPRAGRIFVLWAVVSRQLSLPYP